MSAVAQNLRSLLSKTPHWTELRYHRRQTQSLQVQRGSVKQAKSSSTEGVGIRVFVDGAWGFSATSDLSPDMLEKALKRAIECAKSISQLKKSKLKSLPAAKLAKGNFVLAGYDEMAKMPLEQKLDAVLKGEKLTRDSASAIQSASCSYNEIFEDKIVLTTDGADATSKLVRT